MGCSADVLHNRHTMTYPLFSTTQKPFSKQAQMHESVYEFFHTSQNKDLSEKKEHVHPYTINEIDNKFTITNYVEITHTRD